MKKLLASAFAMLAIFSTSCDDDSDNPTPGETQLASIILNTDDNGGTSQVNYTYLNGRINEAKVSIINRQGPGYNIDCQYTWEGDRLSNVSGVSDDGNNYSIDVNYSYSGDDVIIDKIVNTHDDYWAYRTVSVGGINGQPTREITIYQIDTDPDTVEIVDYKYSTDRIDIYEEWDGVSNLRNAIVLSPSIKNPLTQEVLAAFSTGTNSMNMEYVPIFEVYNNLSDTLYYNYDVNSSNYPTVWKFGRETPANQVIVTCIYE